MCNSFCGKLLLAGACMLTAVAACGQEARRLKTSIDVAVVYQPIKSNVVGNSGFWIQGGSAQIHDQFLRGWGLLADVSGLHAASMNGSGMEMDLVIATFGPRYTWSPPHRRYALFGQALGGRVKSLNSVFPSAAGTVQSAKGLALLVGGGVDIFLKNRLSVRVLEAGWLRTQLPNTTTNVQNSLRLGAGLVYRF